MKKVLGFLCSINIVFGGPLYKPPAVAWQKRIAAINPAYEQIKINKIMDIEEKILCAGSCRKKGSTTTDAYFVLLEKNGDFIRDTAFGGTGNEYVNALYKLPGNAFLAGAANWSFDSVTFSKVNADLWMMKMDLDFRMIKDSAYARQGDNIPNCISKYGDSQFLVGLNNSVFIVDDSLSVVRDTATSWITDIVADTGGTIFCTGMAFVKNPYGVGRNGLWLYRLDKNLRTLWSKGIGHFDSNSPDWEFDKQYSSFLLHDKTAICVGEQSVFRQGWFSSASGVMRATSAGDVLYYKSFQRQNNDFLKYGRALDDTSFIVAGASGTYYSTAMPLYRKFHYNGKLLWEKEISDPSSAPYIMGAGDGGYITVSDNSIIKLSKETGELEVGIRTPKGTSVPSISFRNTNGLIVAIIPKSWDIHFLDIRGRDLPFTRETYPDGQTLVTFDIEGLPLYRITKSPAP